MSEFVCKRCGQCCGLVPFTKKEYNAIRKIAQKRHIGFVKQDLNGKVFYLAKSLAKTLNNIYNDALDGKEISLNHLTCPFLEFNEVGKASCTIYELRPEVCRLFGHGGHPNLVCPNCKE